jgi:hypothetical protein
MAVFPEVLRAFADLPPVLVVPDQVLEVFAGMARLVRAEDFAASSLSSDRLDMIELNLAAHFAIVSLERGGLTSQTVGTSEERYRLISDRAYGLSSTRFGQQALALDSTGVLSALSSSPLKAQFRVI